MAKSLKEKNQPQLITFVLANAVGLGILLQGLKQVLFLLDSLSKGNIAVIFRLVAIPAGLALLIGILGWAVPKRWKETVIFWRTDKNCLPSSRAFSVFALNDPRIDRKRLAKKHGRYRGLGVSCFLEHAGGSPTEGARFMFPGGDTLVIALNVQSTGQGHATVFPHLDRSSALSASRWP